MTVFCGLQVQVFDKVIALFDKVIDFSNIFFCKALSQLIESRSVLSAYMNP